MITSYSLKIWVSILCFMALLIGCRPETEITEGEPTPTIPSLKGTPIPVALSELAANPTIFEEAYIQLTGRYRPLPMLVCESKAQPSPATWGLTSDTLMALAGGFDNQLRPLLPDDITITVAGRWQHWQGVVGCGENAQPQDIWYLDTAQIISPSPITLVTVTPGGVLSQHGDQPVDPSGTSEFQPGPLETPAPGETAVSQPATATIPGTGPNVTPRVTAVPSPTSGSGLTPTATSALFTNTPLPGSTATSPTPTTSNQNTPTPSTTPSSDATVTTGSTRPGITTSTSTPVMNIIDKGELDPEELIMEVVAAGDRHQWTFSNELDDNNLTIYAVSTNDVDIVISVIDPDGTVMVIKNDTGAGQVELVSNLSLSQLEAHQIEIFAANHATGEYGLMALDDLSYPITFHNINYDLPITTSFADTSEEIWLFTGNDNDVVTITADPDDRADIGFDFYGPGGDTLETIDEFTDGDTETLADYSLPSNGLYAIWLYGFADGTIRVDLSVTSN